MGKEYKNIIFTDHAYHRAMQRSIQVHAIYETISSPDFTKKVGDSKTKFYKTINQRKYQVIAIYKSDQKKHLVISAWVRGEEDKPSLVWQLITLPFKLLWFIVSLCFRIIKKFW